MQLDMSTVKFSSHGLICAIAQDHATGEVLMQAYMNEEALQKTLETGYAHYYSRSRKCLWKKGETSGHVQKVVSATFDCDRDCILLGIEQTGAACHTGARSCFHDPVIETKKGGLTFLGELERVVDDRKANPVEGSYTAYLFGRGIDKIAQKMGEEAVEVVIASKNEDKDELVREIADLTYHLMVLMESKGVTLEDVCTELKRRHK
ncbi:MAG TPA: bifunctional phosphoribosyl-AMP cyclohydrolase/phosphoribosyl-ATP diphosphatase HisIE [Candidatus Gallimonas intestinigallinarum]|uniref:Histidine biosynthesis bifunctional protein HisIE n=1 Tax=Candidatus Gallimonas intestinigallinarum TaxID=2838604 RepID=A0A9D2IVP0_9FIRM|nr:bifunctional phosphoribosyl-AMP cyclohydrolase/phosphoribosyl-ATP diphosphatase HisIE [Candidatus Gallimonas intestinigallinarum]